MSTDRELLEAAAKAAGRKINEERQAERDAAGSGHIGLWLASGHTCWNPLTDGSDALRLAAHLKIDIHYKYNPSMGEIVDAMSPYQEDGSRFCATESTGVDAALATCRAITRCAAAMVKP